MIHSGIRQSGKQQHYSISLVGGGEQRRWDIANGDPYAFT
jgi:hypothetical protein